MAKEKKQGNPWLKILGIVVVIIVFLALFDIELIIEEIKKADWGYLGAAIIVLIISYLIMALRLRFMLGNQPKLGYTFHATNVANMMNLITFIPVTMIKIFLMGQNKKVDIPQATSSITIGIAFDYVVKIIALLGVILLRIQTTSVGQFLLVGGILILLILGLLLFLEAKSERIVTKGAPFLARLPVINEEQAQEAVTSFMEGLGNVGSPLKLVITMLWTLLAWIGGFMFYYLGMMAMGIQLSPDLMLAGVLFAGFVVNPFSPYLPGLYHGLLVASIYLVTQADVDSLIALAVILHAALLVVWFGLGALGLRSLNLKFSEFRQQISAGIQQMRAENKKSEIQEI
jgi:uncharacterized membrane protein YbhN (UPF0104 family)